MLSAYEGCQTEEHIQYGSVLMLGVCRRAWNTKTPNMGSLHAWCVQNGTEHKDASKVGGFVLSIYSFLYSNS